MTDNNENGSSTELPPDPQAERVIEINRLAALDSIAYEVERLDAAERLGFRAEKLDKFVKSARRKLGLDGDEDDGTQGKAVTIEDVEPWADPVDGIHVASALAQAFKTYAILPEHVPEVIALWILHTYIVNSFTISPRLAITSPTKGCGKTTILRLLNHTTRRPKGPCGLGLRSVQNPDNHRMVRQFVGLERRTSWGGKDSVDHQPNGHDDVANAVAGCAALAKRGEDPWHRLVEKAFGK